MHSIPVAAKTGTYNILIGSGLLAQVGAILIEQARLSGERCFVLSNPTVWKEWGDVLAQSLAAANIRFDHLLLPEGEPAKRLATVEQAAEQMMRLGADRSSFVLAFGGGVVGDMAGFLAAIFMRGLRYVQIPTTLLAQVDASIGGKTGVNLDVGKNLLGSFHPPECVICDTRVLATLPEREFRAGLFEVMKSGAICDPALFSHCEQQRAAILARDTAAVLPCIEGSVRVKADVVSADEHETGLRRILNFGHTIGHALEAELHYSGLLHGEAVGWGMIAAAKIGRDLNYTPAETVSRIERIVWEYAPPALPPLDIHRVASRVSSDKKTIAGKNRFVLLREIGRAEVVSGVPEPVIADAVAYIAQLGTERR